jgi:hypothetical protein
MSVCLSLFVCVFKSRGSQVRVSQVEGLSSRELLSPGLSRSSPVEGLSSRGLSRGSQVEGFSSRGLSSRTALGSRSLKSRGSQVEGLSSRGFSWSSQAERLPSRGCSSRWLSMGSQVEVSQVEGPSSRGLSSQGVLKSRVFARKGLSGRGGL